MAYWLGLTLYLPLALIGLWATWKICDGRQIGVALVASWAIANIAFFHPDYDSSPAIRAVGITLLGFVSGKAALESRRWAPVIIGTLCVGSCAAIGDYCRLMLWHPSEDEWVNWYRVHRMEVVTNIVFTLQCLVAVWWGKGDAIARRVNVIWRRGLDREYARKGSSQAGRGRP